MSIVINGCSKSNLMAVVNQIWVLFKSNSTPYFVKSITSYFSESQLISLISHKINQHTNDAAKFQLLERRKVYALFLFFFAQ